MPWDTDKNLIIHYDQTDSDVTKTAIYAYTGTGTPGSTNLDTDNFLGTSSGSYTNGQTATIKLKGGVADGHTGLTPGTVYYLQPDGTIATSAGSPSVKYGLAISTTEVLLSNT